MLSGNQLHLPAACCCNCSRLGGVAKGSTFACGSTASAIITSWPGASFDWFIGFLYVISCRRLGDVAATNGNNSAVNFPARICTVARRFADFRLSAHFVACCIAHPSHHSLTMITLQIFLNDHDAVMNHGSHTWCPDKKLNVMPAADLDLAHDLRNTSHICSVFINLARVCV